LTTDYYSLITDDCLLITFFCSATRHLPLFSCHSSLAPWAI
jgi:hypothetical protein